MIAARILQIPDSAGRAISVLLCHFENTPLFAEDGNSTANGTGKLWQQTKEKGWQQTMTKELKLTEKGWQQTKEHGMREGVEN